MNTPFTLLGYHGCDLEIAKKVVLGHPLKESKNEYDWLGHGYYFWEDDIERAYEWAETVSKHEDMFHNKIKTPFVLGAIIQAYNPLDLTVKKARNIVMQSYKTLKSFYKKIDKELPKNKPASKDDIYLKRRELDCLVLDTIELLREIKKKPPFDIIRAPFLEGKPLYEGAGFMDETHIQICVKDISAIKGFFIPPEFLRLLRNK